MDRQTPGRANGRAFSCPAAIAEPGCENASCTRYNQAVSVIRQPVREKYHAAHGEFYIIFHRGLSDGS
jgi:hypothetical protein